MEKAADMVPKTMDLKTKAGRTYVLSEPSVMDLADAEALIGRPIAEWFEESMTLREVAALLWICARKTGLSGEQQVARKWEFTLDAFMNSLSAPDVMGQMDRVADFFTSALGSESQDDASSTPSG